MLKNLRAKLRWPSAKSRKHALCVLPWLHLHVGVDGNAFPCCVALNGKPLGSLRHSSAVDLFNAKPLRQLRRDMMAGVRNSYCQHCYTIEDANGTSLREVFNKYFAQHADEVERTSPDGSVDPEKIVYLDVRFSNLCNLRCRSCGSAASTAWYQDDPHTAPKDFRIVRPTASPERLWAEIEPFLGRAEKLHFAGGEPMMMDETYQTLERLLEIGRTDVALTYNTNASTWTHRDWDVLELWKSFKNVTVMASVDGSGARGEYIRKGMNWRKIIENCKRVRRECPDAWFQLNFTIGLMNALHLPDFLDECLAEGLIEADRLDLNFIQHPVHLSLTSLPPALKANVRRLYGERIAELRLSETGKVMAHRMRAAIDYMDSRDTTSELGKFRRFTRDLDQKRGESFVETFPELAELMSVG